MTTTVILSAGYYTLFGGYDDGLAAHGDRCIGVAFDADNNIFISGSTASLSLPLANEYQGSLRGQSDAFVAGLSCDGTSLLFSTYFGGSGDEQPEGRSNANGYEDDLGGIVEANNSCYILLRTWSIDMPVTAAARIKTLRMTHGDTRTTYLKR